MNCPICGHAECLSVVQYREPPAGEVRFKLEGAYFREYFECRSCGHFFSSFRWPEKQVYEGGYVEANYGGIEGIRRNFARVRGLSPGKSDNVGRVQFVCDYVRKTGRGAFSQLHLLDVGAGLGVFPAAMKDAGWNSHALDPDPTACKHLVEDLAIPAYCGDFMVTQVERCFDLISLNKVLEHVVDPISMLRRCSSLVAPGGLAYMELPDGEGAAEESFNREEFFIDHLHVFSVASYALCAKRAGFRVLALERLREPSAKFTLRGFLAFG